MKKPIPAVLLTGVFFLLAGTAWAQDLRVELTAAPAEFDQGNTPVFTLVLKNSGQKTIRVLPLEKQSGSYDLVIEKSGKVINGLPVAIWDPAVVGPQDYKPLMPGEVLKGVIRYPQALAELMPGDYEVEHRYRMAPTPGHEQRPILTSNKLKIKIRENKKRGTGLSGSKTQLTQNDVIKIAQASVRAEKIDPEKYIVTGCHYEFTHKDHLWTVFFTRKSPAPPGGHFAVLVDDRTKKTSFMRGE